jgi:hypothetical protein
MRFRALAVPAAWLAFLSYGYGCGAAPSAPVVAPAAGPSTPAAPVAVVATGPNLAEVPDPAGLVVSGRLANPAAALAIVRDWTGLPMPQPEDAFQLLTGVHGMDVLDFDQPVDFALSVSGSGTRLHEAGAVSIALHDADRAKAALADHYKLSSADNGVVMLRKAEKPSKDDADDDAEESDRACEIAPAFGPASTRLVCSWSSKGLSELGPWLTRTATRKASSGGDLHLDFRMDPLRSTIAAERRFFSAILTGVVRPEIAVTSTRDALSSVLGDLVDFALDLGGASLDVRLEAPKGTAALTWKFTGHAAALTRFLTAHPERNGPAPAAFWQLPGDADSAFFERGVDEATLARGRDLVLHVVEEGLGDAGVAEADRKAIIEALGKMGTSAPIAMANGTNWDVARKAFAAEKALRDGADAAGLDEAERAAQEALIGWHVLVVDEPAAKLQDAVKSLFAVGKRPGVAAALRGKGAAMPGTMPLPKGSPLPATTQHYVLDLPARHPGESAGTKPKGAVVHKPLVVHVFVAPDGARTWLGIGAGEGDVASKLAAAMSATGDKLSGRTELASLQTGSVGQGGFGTVRGTASGAGHQAVRMVDELSQLPHGGKVGIVFALTPASDSQVTTSVEVPRGAIEDVVNILMRHGF